MSKRNTVVFIIVFIVFAIGLSVVLPVDAGALGKKDFRMGLDLLGGLHIVYKADLSQVEPGSEAEVMDGVVAVLSNRVNPLGVTEPVIQKLGSDRVALELPGLNITEKDKERLSRVALLEFGEMVKEGEEAKWEDQLGKWKPATAIIDGVEKELTSRYFKDNTYVASDDMGKLVLVFEWDEEGSKLSKEITGRLMNQPLGIFEGDDALRGEDGRPIAPIVRSVISDRGQIEGLSMNEAKTLSQQLNAGRLPVALEILYDQTVSPILGSEFIGMTAKAGIIGIILVMLFMILYYRVPGVLASLALIFYGVVNMAIFKLVPVTLTLAGLGGFILSIGMAVDANVLIFERMKEELRTGRTLGAAIDAGFSRAWTAIRDSNITTFIACIILYWLGGSIVASAPVQGFSLTLFIGVAVSMFTALVVTRVLLRFFVGRRLAQRVSLFNPYQGRK